MGSDCYGLLDGSPDHTLEVPLGLTQDTLRSRSGLSGRASSRYRSLLSSISRLSSTVSGLRERDSRLMALLVISSRPAGLFC
jgi:hypothetical protein